MSWVNLFFLIMFCYNQIFHSCSLNANFFLIKFSIYLLQKMVIQQQKTHQKNGMNINCPKT